MKESEMAAVIAGHLFGRDVHECGAYMITDAWPLGSKSVNVVLFGPEGALQRFKLTVEEVEDW